MARYLFEFYQEIQLLNKSEYLNPPFPILIYNGDRKWDAPERFSELLYPSAVPREYLPEFRYFKIAVNEIPRRELVKIRNAVAAVFYIENSTPEDIAKNRTELVSLLSSVLKKDGIEILNAIKDRMQQMQNFPASSKTIKTIEDLTEVMSMWETRVKKYYDEVLEQGIEKGIEKGIEQKEQEITEKMIRGGMSNYDIRKITGMTLSKIERMRRHRRSR
jgi:predicted transposase/invertase (TIGR01784 family)